MKNTVFLEEFENIQAQYLLLILYMRGEAKSEKLDEFRGPTPTACLRPVEFTAISTLFIFYDIQWTMITGKVEFEFLIFNCLIFFFSFIIMGINRMAGVQYFYQFN
jgi:hypothetical protein